MTREVVGGGITGSSVWEDELPADWEVVLSDEADEEDEEEAGGGVGQHGQGGELMIRGASRLGSQVNRKEVADGGVLEGARHTAIPLDLRNDEEEGHGAMDDDNGEGEHGRDDKQHGDGEHEQRARNIGGAHQTAGQEQASPLPLADADGGRGNRGMVAMSGDEVEEVAEALHAHFAEIVQELDRGGDPTEVISYSPSVLLFWSWHSLLLLPSWISDQLRASAFFECLQR